MMYLKFFGLETKPFHTTPDPHFLYLSSSHKQALGSIIYGINEKKGFIAVTGQVGLGKTTVLRSFLAQMDQANQQTIYLLNPNLSFTHVLTALLDDLGHGSIGGHDAELVEQLHMVLIEEYQKDRTVVLLIDEAQNMPVATLEQLRMLSNLETPKDKLLQIVLLGQPELDSILDRYELRQIRQRIAVRAIILPLSQEESVHYIQHRLDKAGGKGKAVFTKSALSLIVREAKGIPRRLNILCDNALVTAFGYKKLSVTASIAKEVIGDLNGQQPSQSLWKLVPLAAGALILLLALVALLPLTNSHFPETASLPEVRQLTDGDGTPNQDVLTVEKDHLSSKQEGFTLVERAQAWLTELVPTVVANLQELPISDPTLNAPDPQAEVDAALESPGVVVLATKSKGALKDSLLGVSTKPKDLAVPETATPSIPVHQPQVFDLSEQEEVLVADEAQLFPVETRRLDQVESEPSVNNSVAMNPVYPNPENLKNRSVPMAENVAEGPKGSLNKEILPPAPATTAKKPVPKKEFPSKKPKVVEATLLVTKVMKRGDTLARLMKGVYGSASPSTLRFVLDHNPHIRNVRKIYPGQKIVFPPLKKKGVQKTLVDATPTLVSHEEKKLSSSKKIFTGSSAQPKQNQERNEANRESTYAVAIVREGDTLEKLAKMVYGSSDPLYIQRVLAYNPQIRNSKKIFPGQDIAFPRIVGVINVLDTQSSQGDSPE